MRTERSSYRLRDVKLPVLSAPRARAAGLAPTDTAKGLEELLRRRVLHETRGGLDFTHASIREVAYGQLSPPRRKLLRDDPAAKQPCRRPWVWRLEQHPDT